MTDCIMPDCGLVQLLNARLAASEMRLRNILERSPDALLIVDASGMIQFANPTAASLFGVPSESMINQPFVYPLAAQEWANIDIVGFAGERRVAEMRVADVEWNGQQAHFVVLRDITERARAERALQESESRLALAMDTAMLGFWDIDLRTDRVAYNDKVFENLGYRPGELQLTREAWRDMTHPDDLPRVQQAFYDHLQGRIPIFHTEFRMRMKDGSWNWFRSQCEIVERDPKDGSPHRVIGVTENITERKAAEEDMLRVAQHDALTGLPNRALLIETAEHFLASARRRGRRNGIAFLFIDLDRFKPINDTYGHDAGDTVLREMAHRLLTSVRGEDLVGRLGGDEFILVLPHIGSGDDAATRARLVLSALERPFRLNHFEVLLTASIGISIFPQDGTTADELLKNADTAMYRAKQDGPNSFQFSKREFNERVTQAARIESRLRRGLEQNEFVLFYQPVIETNTNTVAGIEALLRWPAIDAAPEQFLSVAESSGFMHTLGRWIFKEACRQRAEWHAHGLPFIPLSINVSLAEFRRKEFIPGLRDTLAELRFDADEITIEVTENTVMRHVEEAAEVLQSIKALGLKVALDDFGTGYSNLYQLARLPLDTLKLDRSFVHQLEHDGASMAAVDSVMALGETLHLDVIAEGVESTTELDRLISKRCHLAQGFHFSHPLPAYAFEQWMRRRV